nr:hypothetical protein [Tanacetum cinerariifolium]
MDYMSEPFRFVLLAEAYDALDPIRNITIKWDIISWTPDGYVVVVTMYNFQQYRHTSPPGWIECDERVNEYVLASVVRCVKRLGSVVKDCLLHSLVVKSGLGEDVYVGTSVVDFYCKVGRVEDARMVFDSLVVKNVVTWTTMIVGYARVGKSEISLELLSIMKESDVVLDRYVISSALSACSILGFLEGGKQIHGFVLRRGASMDISVSNELVDFYVKCDKNSFDDEAMSLFIDMTRNQMRLHVLAL